MIQDDVAVSLFSAFWTNSHYLSCFVLFWPWKLIKSSQTAQRSPLRSRRPWTESQEEIRYDFLSTTFSSRHSWLKNKRNPCKKKKKKINIFLLINYILKQFAVAGSTVLKCCCSAILMCRIFNFSSGGWGRGRWGPASEPGLAWHPEETDHLPAHPAHRLPPLAHTARCQERGEGNKVLVVFWVFFTRHAIITYCTEMILNAN